MHVDGNIKLRNTALACRHKLRAKVALLGEAARYATCYGRCNSRVTWDGLCCSLWFLGSWQMSEDPETSSGCVASGLSIERRKSNRIFIRKRAERKGRELW